MSSHCKIDRFKTPLELCLIFKNKQQIQIFPSTAHLSEISSYIRWKKAALKQIQVVRARIEYAFVRLCLHLSVHLSWSMKWLKQLLHPSTINKLWRSRAQIHVFSLAGRAATEEEELMVSASFAY